MHHIFTGITLKLHVCKRYFGIHDDGDVWSGSEVAECVSVGLMVVDGNSATTSTLPTSVHLNCQIFYPMLDRKIILYHFWDLDLIDMFLNKFLYNLTG